MKKTIIILAIIISLLSLNKEEKIVIPKDSIRFRIIANSNSPQDQNLKKKIIANLANEKLLSFKSSDINNSRQQIQNNITTFQEVIENTLQEESPSTKYTINYGKNYFPKKEYQNIIYEEGEYESLVVTLGNGTGNNFWCVLFPPLCLIETNKPKTDKIEYKSLIKETLMKYF